MYDDEVSHINVEYAMQSGIDGAMMAFQNSKLEEFTLSSM